MRKTSYLRFRRKRFSLAEIKSLLLSDENIDSEKIRVAMESRLENIREQSDLIHEQKIQIESVQAKYLKLYAAVGPHMNTVVNADDRASLELVASPIIKKTRYF